MARDLEDDSYYISRGGKIPIRWSPPEVTLHTHSIIQCIHFYVCRHLLRHIIYSHSCQLISCVIYQAFRARTFVWHVAILGPKFQEVHNSQ